MAFLFFLFFLFFLCLARAPDFPVFPDFPALWAHLGLFFLFFAVFLYGFPIFPVFPVFCLSGPSSGFSCFSCSVGTSWICFPVFCCVFIWFSYFSCFPACFLEEGSCSPVLDFHIWEDIIILKKYWKLKKLLFLMHLCWTSKLSPSPKQSGHSLMQFLVRRFHWLISESKVEVHCLASDAFS